MVALRVTDGAGNTAVTTLTIDVGAGDPGEAPATLVYQGEDFLISDANGDTVARLPSTPEGGANAANSGEGLLYDANGLWDGYLGNGYIDMGLNAGDSVGFEAFVSGAGTYELTVRYANGGDAARPMQLIVNGQIFTMDFPSTGSWTNWAETTVSVPLNALSNAISFVNIGDTGPNIDQVALAGQNVVDDREQIYYAPVARVNFQPAGEAIPAGYFADTGAAFGADSGGLSFGWITQDSIGAGDSTPAANSSSFLVDGAELDPLIATGISFDSGPESYAWEMALEDGTYMVKVSLGQRRL